MLIFMHTTADAKIYTFSSTAQDLIQLHICVLENIHVLCARAVLYSLAFKFQNSFIARARPLEQ